MAIDSTPSGSEIAAEWGKTLAGSKGTDYLGESGGLPTALPLKGTDFVGKSAYTPMSTPTLSTTSVTLKAAALNGAVAHGTNVTCNVSGGNASKTFTWEKVSGTTLGGSLNTQTAYLSRSATGQITTSVYRCKVTDGVGTVYSPNVTINFYHYNLLETMPTICERFVTDPQDALATITFSRNGTVSYPTSGTTTTTADWVAPKSSTVGDDFDLYVNDTTVSGDNANFTATNITKNTATTINANRTCGLSRISPGQYIAGVRCRIRCKQGGLGYVYDDTVSLRATVGSSGGGIGSIVQFIDTILQ